MKAVSLHGAFAALLLSVVGSAHALDYKSVGATPAVLYDAPSLRGKKVFVAPRNMPVEVILTYGEWSKVRDASGGLAWVESKALAAKRYVVVKTANARIHAAADEASPAVFVADKGVLLELSEAAVPGWVKVKHRDGQTGFVKAADVWGE
ncbi:SH3-like domain-containing protein [Actimicrobium sp. GrIS 1.19]|uniref:SH3 domain-containing protein n=1 Tax=Actimicrobium sp. GrIS 1.19 TaxID=3071708 RepID=UPI002E00EC27|nr:SH3-like domain-containing protein [Actimicrobium sp. GrIS 1.19]